MIKFVYKLLPDCRNIWDITLYCQLHSAIHQLYKMLNISAKTEFSYVYRYICLSNNSQDIRFL